jgi:hypothetical protein
MNPNHELSNGKFGLLSTEMICERMQTAVHCIGNVSFENVFYWSNQRESDTAFGDMARNEGWK